MNSLQTLRSQLRLMSWARIALRWSCAITMLLCVVLLVLGGLYAVDFGLERLGLHTTAMQRSVLLLVGIAICLTAVVFYVWPLLWQSESEVDLALMIESEQKIDSDLVAALQFESPQASPWGSQQLQNAVIDYVADWSRGLKFNDGLSGGLVGQALIWLGVLAAAAALWIGLALFSPADIFFQRLCLSSIHYPSATTIERIVINTFEFSPVDPADVRVAEGQEVRFKISARGVLPKEGVAQLRSVDGNAAMSVALNQAEETKTGAHYLGSLPQLRTKVSYQLFLGDAWTEPETISIVPLPIIKPSIEVTPPAYARLAADKDDAQLLQRSVLEGSSVQIGIAETSKPLRSASLTIGSGANQQVLALRPADAAAKADVPFRGVWKLPVEGTPFARIAEPVAFQLQVVDEDNLGLELPLRGSIRLKDDRRPQISAEIKHRVVVSNASPVIKVRLRDDFGISKVQMDLKIVRTSKGGMEQDHVVPIPELLVAPPDSETGEKGTSPVPLRLPYAANQLPIAGAIVLPLATYQLDKGDQVRISLEATDFRGNLPGEKSTSEQLVLEVTDVSGVLADTAKRDEQAIKDLTDILNLQSGNGESK